MAARLVVCLVLLLADWSVANWVGCWDCLLVDMSEHLMVVLMVYKMVELSVVYWVVSWAGCLVL